MRANPAYAVYAAPGKYRVAIMAHAMFLPGFA